MKTVVVTGCSTGIGLATAIATARAGWHTVATVPDIEHAGSLRSHAEQAGVLVDVRPLDLTDPAAIAALVAGLDHVDALVTCPSNERSELTLEVAASADLRATMEHSFFGVLAMTQALLPLLRAARGRLIAVVGARGVIGYPFEEGASAAAAAVEAYLESLAPVAFQVGVYVSVVEPGPVLVDPVTTDAEAMAEAAGPYLGAFVTYRHWLATQALEGAQSPAEVADVVLATLSAERPVFRVATSPHAAKLLSLKLADTDGTAVQEMTRPWVTLPKDTRWLDPSPLIQDAELLALHRAVMARTVDLIAQIRADQWSWPTPCGRWTLRELVDHMIVDNVRFGAGMTKATVAGPSYAESVDHVLDAFAGPGVLSRELELPHVGRGRTFVGRLALGFHYLDYLVHGWDVAVSLGVPFSPSAREIEVVELIARRDVPDGPRRHNPLGGFQPPLPIADDVSAWHRVLAYLGRDPAWRPARA